MRESREQQLINDLDALVARGVRGPEDILDGAPRLLTLITKPGSEWVRATAVYRLLHAATDALGTPRGDALRALLALNPVIPGCGPRLNKTERRDDAAQFYGGIAGDSFRKMHEKKLILALAIEMDRRLATGDDTTHVGDTERENGKVRPIRPLPQNPPPPASAFKAIRKPSRADNRKGSDV
ncbi:hypothetical protein E0F15_11290 [Frankia sp. B2]|uniref:hypothetical protein n=1 Tax=unclassified Frankia TaxID=2632575 RepID=UPI0004610A82|nr:MULTISPECIES: hypothetical protein [unclassified Frankia]KDA40760.1 hypothetical protein BMG523Draft_04424 [Frankia sp. BMG5.23]TFE30432.1 hypothetical protein E0F15_11290 [Frankia sp. B2]